MNSSPTQIESYEKSKPFAGTQRERLFKAVSENPDLSRKELSRLTGILLQSVCAGVNKLVNDGDLYESGTKYDAETDRNVATLRVVAR